MKRMLVLREKKKRENNNDKKQKGVATFSTYLQDCILIIYLNVELYQFIYNFEFSRLINFVNYFFGSPLLITFYKGLFQNS
ncbi:hypothetical protein RDI58_013143 [Solanum bulbocastanum]|uniref:Uncharacterized protein n=1 Tax=Solanum bulbocastanum TaxID=147425 RepID=A0AAN8TKD1_SOLBU